MNTPSVKDVTVEYRIPYQQTDMLSKRAAIALLLIPFVMWVIADGQWLFLVGVSFVLSLAVFEFASLFRRVGRRPVAPLMVVGVLAMSVSRFFIQFDNDALIVGSFCILAMAWHVREFERGNQRAGTDFAISVAGFVYVGWVGSYLVLLRRMPDGLNWFLIVLPAIWMADSMAYLVGKAIGRHRLAPRTSPKKSWEGYFAGILGGVLGGVLFVKLWGIGVDPGLSLETNTGIVVGAAVGIFGPIGDLGISMLKREVGAKDSGGLLPGHGGALDRMDSWFWAAFIGYHLVLIMGV